MKEYVEERELTALLVVDLSASKEFGTGPKANALIACEIAAILAFAATRNNDRVGLLLVTDRVELFVAPDSGRRHVLRLVLELLSFRPQGRGTKLSVGLEYAMRVLKRRSAVFVVSDFLLDETSDPGFIRAARRLARDHDLIPVRLTDPGGNELPNVGLLVLVDPETGERHVVNTGSARVRAAYARNKAEQHVALTSVFRELQLDVVEVDTTKDVVPALVGFFRHRERAVR
jgi:uncharacterized protein (DUF58 family)